MAGLILLLAITVPFFHDDIKGIDYYSFFSQTPKIEYKLSSDEDASSFKELKYVPHVSSFTGLAIGTELINLSIAFQNEDEDKKDVEESDLFDLQFSGVYDKFFWELYYQNYIGLYVTDDDVDDSNLPKVNSFAYGLGVKYFTKDGYKLNQSLGSYKKKKRTDWSWLVGAYHNRFRLYSEDDTLLPTEYQTNFDQLVGLSSLEALNYGLEGGISGMYTIGGFYTSALLSVGINYQEQKFTGIDTDSRNHTTNSLAVLYELGYDWKHSAFGISLSTQTISSPVKNAQFDQSRSQGTIYYKYFF